MEQYRKMTKREFINLIEREYDDNSEFDVFTINFDIGQKISNRNRVNKKRMNMIANQSKCIIFSSNEYLSHVDIHSAFQTDIYNIKPKGIMNTIMLGYHQFEK